MQIRKATIKDTPIVLGLIRELAEFEKLSHEVVATEDLLNTHLFSDNKSAEALIAEHEGVAVGMAIYFFNFSTFLGRPGLYLEDLYVSPQRRRSGVGRALLQRLAAIAVDRGCGRMEWSVLDWNQKAIEFYKQLNAKPMDEWTVFRLDGDALKSLAQNKSFTN